MMEKNLKIVLNHIMKRISKKQGVSMEHNQDILKEVTTFIKEHPNVCESYAHVWNLLVSQPHAEVTEELSALLHQLEFQIALEHMEEYCWERDDNNRWHRVNSTEFFNKYRAAHGMKKVTMYKMEFVFSEEKARALGYTAEACYEAVDKVFAQYDIYPTSQGVYEAHECQNSFTAFAVAHKLPYTDWFLKVIDTWLYSEDDDPNDKSDCLAKFYEIEERNRYI